MKTHSSTKAAIVAAAGIGSQAFAQEQTPGKRPEELIAELRSTNDTASASACDNAAEYGASAVQPLAFTMAEATDFELARRCKRALLRIIHHAGRPGAKTEASAVETELLPLISRSTLPAQVRRDLLWMLSEIGSARAVQPVADLLADKDLREDARCVLIRMPFAEATAALKQALASGPEDFRPALADALRSRGEKVDGYPSRKLVPTAKTTVTPLQKK